MPRAISIDNVYIHISADEKECAQAAAEHISLTIKNNSHSRISFANGFSIATVYQQLSEIVKRQKIDCSQIECFQLSEYYPCPEEALFSFKKYLNTYLVRPLFLADEQFHFFNANTMDPQAECERFDALLHDIDLCVLGVGPGGHVGFNESGSEFDTRTRVVNLSAETIARDHDERGQDTPTQGLTQGMANIMSAESVILIATGEKKAKLIYQVLREGISQQCPASALRVIPQKAKVFLDEAAAKLL